MSSLKRQIRNMPGGTFWVVSGERGKHGAVTWGVLTDEDGTGFADVVVHSPRPTPASRVPVRACPHLPAGCYSAVALSGEVLGKRWKKARGNDEVIWKALEAFYKDRLANLGEVAS